MKRSIMAVCIALLIFAGCKEDSTTPVSTTTHPYSGSWKIVFAGTYTGSGTINIGTDGKFSANVLLFAGSTSFTNTITGAVSSSGSMSADIYYSGSKIGNCGGTFSGSGGSGSYQTSQPSSGTWSATKQ